VSGFRVSKSGSWNAARKKLGDLSDPRKKLLAALRRACLVVEREMKLGLQASQPGGEELKPLAPLTVFLRRNHSSAPLLDTGALLGAVTTKVDEKELEGFVGVMRSGRGQGSVDRARLAEIHEFGVEPYAIPVTPAMRRFFLAVALQSGGRFSPLRADTTVIYHPGIPARPFVRPTLRAALPKVQEQVNLTFSSED
jgi:hypothetical protein